MPRRKRDSHVFDLARRGAEARIRELAQETKELMLMFPDLRDSFDPDELPLPFIIAKGSGRVKRSSTERPRRRRMSASARARISAAQKARWAKLKATQKK